MARRRHSKSVTVVSSRSHMRKRGGGRKRGRRKR